MHNLVKDQKADETPNTEVLAFLVESFGEKIKSFLDEIQDSYELLNTLGEKDSLAQAIEEIHYQPESIAVKSISNGKQILSALIHKKLKENIFLPNQEKIEYLLGGKYSHTYFVKLKVDSPQDRDFFREAFFQEYQNTPLTQFIFVDLEFVPEGMNISDFTRDKVSRIALA